MNNLQAFSDMVGWSEGTITIPTSDRGYNVLVGSTPHAPILFDSYDTHPDIYNPKFNSTAAGKHQIIRPTWANLCLRLNVTDFGPETQEAMFQSLVTIDCRALDVVETGQIAAAIMLCSKLWASLPGSIAKQRQNTVTNLVNFYVQSGGIVDAFNGVDV